MYHSVDLACNKRRIWACDPSNIHLYRLIAVLHAYISHTNTLLHRHSWKTHINNWWIWTLWSSNWTRKPFLLPKSLSLLLYFVIHNQISLSLHFRRIIMKLRDNRKQSRYDSLLFLGYMYPYWYIWSLKINFQEHLNSNQKGEQMLLYKRCLPSS